MQACPYDALYIDPDDHTAQKCNYCAHRVEVGIEPACVVVCPEQAIVAGDLEDPDNDELRQMVAAGDLRQRAVERGTKPEPVVQGCTASQTSSRSLQARIGQMAGIWRDPQNIEQSWLNVDLTTDADGNRTGVNAAGSVISDDRWRTASGVCQ